MSEQLQKDLERRAAERLEQWIIDCEDLFDAGGLSSGHAHEAITKQLVYALSLAITKWTRGVTDEQFVELFRGSLQRARERIRQEHYDRRAT